MAIAIGWHAENFARMGKSMKNLDAHLTAAAKPDPEEGAAALRGMFTRMKERQEAGNGAG